MDTLINFEEFENLTEKEKLEKIRKNMKGRVDSIKEIQLSVCKEGTKKTILDTHFFMEGLFMDCYALFYGVESLEKHIDQILALTEKHGSRAELN
jgi:hypothetical protein